MTRTPDPFADPDGAFFSTPPGDRGALLLRLGWELTVAAREYYAAGTDELTDPAAVRVVNEVQHRVLAHADACLSGRDLDAPAGYGWVADCGNPGGLRGLVRQAFARAYRGVRPPAAAAG